MSADDEHVTYLAADEFNELLRTLDEPDDISGILGQLRRNARALAERTAIPQQVTTDRLSDDGLRYL